MKSIIITIAAFITVITVHAQHQHHVMDSMPAQPHQPADSSMQHSMPHQHMAGMSHAYSLSLPMNRNGSGTAWQPENTPMYAYMKHNKRWMLMMHGNIFIRQNWQNFNNSSRRGGNKLDAPNWLMGMAQRQVGKNGLFTASAMVSLDRITTGGNGYPLLFQSGETWKNQPLVDRQHPHDLFSGLSVGYTQRLSKDIDLSAYFGYPGEPALGPTAFMHRISSLSNPDAPLSHHWQDATHITFGTGTLGIRYKWLKLEGSIFTGREPDENRYNFDKARFDSYSWRLSVAPVNSLVFQVSQGYIKSPESLHPTEDVTRTTASVIHAIPVSKGSINSTLAWGLNDAGDHHQEHSLLAESNWISGKNMLYGRYEFVQKSADELALESTAGHSAAFNIHALKLGYSRTLFSLAKTDVAIGGQATWHAVPTSLQPFYGSNPLSAQLYLRITPSMLKM